MATTELFLRPPTAVPLYEHKDYVLIKCNRTTWGMVTLFGYNAILIALCTFYAFRTRKTPLNFNEAKFIGFCMYTTCVIWIAFLPVYYGVGGGFEAVALAPNIPSPLIGCGKPTTAVSATAPWLSCVEKKYR